MSVFDRVVFNCPNCDGIIVVQSKGASEPSLRTYSAHDVPIDVASGVILPKQCSVCSTPIKLHPQINKLVALSIVKADYEDSNEDYEDYHENDFEFQMDL
jgi:hypothetical protein